jgi:hypothetical protein
MEKEYEKDTLRMLERIRAARGGSYEEGRDLWSGPHQDILEESSSYWTSAIETSQNPETEAIFDLDL